jgi:hypothetical protein
MGILPRVFGPFMWATIHYICLGAPSELSKKEQEVYKTFFINLPPVMPCHSCGVNLIEHYKDLPIDPFLKTKKDLFAWSVKIHNMVNKSLNKKEITVEEAEKIWLHNIPIINVSRLSENETIEYDNKKNSDKYFYLFIISIVIIIILLIIIYNMNSFTYRKLRSRS